MKNLILGAFALLLATPVFAADAKVAIAVSGTPCTAGPTNCALLAGEGTVKISQGTTSEDLTIDPSGITTTTLKPGMYTFTFKSPMRLDSKVTQDIRNAGDRTNFVHIQYDTGIR